MADSRNELLEAEAHTGPDLDWTNKYAIQAPAPLLEPLIFDPGLPPADSMVESSQFSYSTALTCLVNYLSEFIKFLPQAFAWLGGGFAFCYARFFGVPGAGLEEDAEDRHSFSSDFRSENGACLHTS